MATRVAFPFFLISFHFFHSVQIFFFFVLFGCFLSHRVLATLLLLPNYGVKSRFTLLYVLPFHTYIHTHIYKEKREEDGGEGLGDGREGGWGC